MDKTKLVSHDALRGKTISRVACGNIHLPNHGSYDCTTFYMTDGTEFAVGRYGAELVFWEILP